MIETILKKFGLSDKEIKTYLCLLKIGSASGRTISNQTGINRTTTNNVLNKLSDFGIISSVEKTKRKHYSAESPEHLLHALKIKEQGLKSVQEDIKSILPELKSLYEKSESKPKAKYFEGDTGLRGVLENVLESIKNSPEKKYYVYSSSSIRETLHRVFPNWNDERLKNKISVQTISIGKGGSLHGMDERKWLSEDIGAPTYTIIYANKIAHISLNEYNDPIGVVIEDKNTYKTQTMIFEALWKKI